MRISLYTLTVMSQCDPIAEKKKQEWLRMSEFNNPPVVAAGYWNSKDQSITVTFTWDNECFIQ